MYRETGLDCPVVGLGGAGPRVDYQVHRRQLLLDVTERFADEPLDPVTRYGPTGRLDPYREAQPHMTDCVVPGDDEEERIRGPKATLVDRVELRLGDEAALPREITRGRV
jgi:hypothetical protein